MTLALSILALLAGPLLYVLGRRSANLRQVIDGFVFITVAGIVCVFITPAAIEAGGVQAVVALLLGLGFPVAVERIFERSMQRAHVFILLLAALGLVVHAVIDGIALLPGPQLTNDPAVVRGDGLYGSLFDNQLALGVILHRLPVGMAIWWSVRESFGTAAAVGTFLLIIAATTAAFVLGEPVIELASTRTLAAFQAFVAGSLVHVVVFGVTHDHHAHSHGANERRGEHAAHHGALRVVQGGWAYRVGILVGMFIVFTVPHLHG